MLKLSTRNFLISLALLAAVLLTSAALSSRKQAPAEVAVSVTRPITVAATVNTMYTPGLSPERRAFSAEEEAYSVALWRIHDKVKTSAVQLSFAGLSYKLKEIDREGIKTRVAPQLEIYRTAQVEMAKLNVPASMAELHGTYTRAVQLYQQASTEMIKIAADGDEQHLLTAHSDTNTAATLLLKVGGELWPGEFKPN